MQDAGERYQIKKTVALLPFDHFSIQNSRKYDRKVSNFIPKNLYWNIFAVVPKICNDDDEERRSERARESEGKENQFYKSHKRNDEEDDEKLLRIASVH